MRTKILSGFLTLTILVASSPALAQESSGSDSTLCQGRILQLKQEGQDPLAEIRKLQKEKDNPSHEMRITGAVDAGMFGLLFSAPACMFAFKSCVAVRKTLAAIAVGTTTLAVAGGYVGSIQDSDRISNVDQQLACLKSHFGEAASNSSPKSTTAVSPKGIYVLDTIADDERSFYARQYAEGEGRPNANGAAKAK